LHLQNLERLFYSYYLYINQLQKIEQIKYFAVKMNNILLKYCHKFRDKPTLQLSMAPVSVYEQLQEDLLLADPTQWFIMY